MKLATKKVTLIDGKEYTLTGLTVDEYFTYAETEDPKNGISKRALIAVTLSLKHEHPEMTEKEAGSLLTFPLLGEIFQTVLDISGLGAKGEAAPVVAH